MKKGQGYTPLRDQGRPIEIQSPSYNRNNDVVKIFCRGLFFGRASAFGRATLSSN